MMNASALQHQIYLMRRYLSFLSREVEEIEEGGLPVLLRKVRTFLVMIPRVLTVLVVRALRPIVLIRFGTLYGGRIGHFALDAKLYQFQRDVGMQSRAMDISPKLAESGLLYGLPLSGYRCAIDSPEQSAEVGCKLAEGHCRMPLHEESSLGD